MHSLAKKWDDENSRKASKHIVKDDVLIPINRPCDWCGKKVDSGYIHDECEKKERSFYLDILY